MLGKTFTTFHASNVLLQQQYRERKFKKYFELISCLLVAEQNNELLMKYHQSRPTGTEPFPEVNAILSQTNGRGRSHGRGRGWGRGRGRNSRYHGTHNNNSTHKGKLQCTTRSGIISRQNKMRSMRRIRLPRAMRIQAIYVV